jgi:ABC-2 type transport system permease protein
VSSLARTFSALPTMARVGLAEAVAYRAELLIWILSTTMPLVMMPLWLAVTRGGPVQGMSSKDVVAYVLATFITRQMTTCWVSWQINWEVRQGTLSARLLRPVSPLVAYAMEHLTSLPMRLVIALPITVTFLVVLAGDSLPHTVALWALTLASLVGAWVLTFFVHVSIGALSLFLQSSIRVMDVWFAGFMVFSGYLIPLRMFPPWVREFVDWLPFRYQLGVPVELLTSAHALPEALSLVARQWGFALLAVTVALLLWKRGVTRFSAYGG